MYRFIAVSFSLIVIALSIVGVLDPTGGLSIVMSTSFNIAILRIALVSLLLAYSIHPKWRYDLPRKTLLLASFGIVWFFLASIFVDNNPYPGPVDLFFGLEGAFLSAIACLDFPRPKTAQIFMPHVTSVNLSLPKLHTIKFLRPTLRTGHKPT